MERIKDQIPTALEEFNNSQIDLHDTGYLWSHHNNNSEKPQVDKNSYMEAIKSCRWYGPYKHDSHDYFYFYSIS